MNTSRQHTDWQAVFAVIAAGVIVSMQVGKLPPLLGQLRAEFGLDLVLGGLVASSISLIGGLCGIMAGFAGDRIGGRRALMSGLLINAAGSLAGAFAHDTAFLLAARLVEGLGFVITVVCGPSLVAMAAQPAQRSLALGLWSSYMPLGVTLGMLGALAVNHGLLDWRGLWLVLALLPFAAALLLPRLTARVPVAPLRKFNAAVLRRPGPWLLAGCFACYTTQWFCIVTWIPTYLKDSGLENETLLALGVAAVALVNAVGTTVSAAVMHRGTPRWLIIAVVSLSMGALGTASFAPDIPVLAKIGFAMAASGFGGMLPAAVLAGVPVQTRDPSEIATVNGVVVQLLNIGSFVGPPALAALVAHFGGWADGRWLLMVAGSIGLLLALGLRAAERRMATA
ncbi:MFS transporter [Ferrovibrio terrae]|uniref:MFS transporter n=1 Tax=Ferrovibrio terrae TaxID=2594003 RepID=A0A516H291_9PROT|nr:MFS transporter [Ferrovibrio terrae]QDO97891.1 MFS transporter [Ferrovibrio terrae]